MPRLTTKEALDSIVAGLVTVDQLARVIRVGMLNHVTEDSPDVQLIDRNLARIHNAMTALHGYEIDKTSVLRLFHETPSFREVK